MLQQVVFGLALLASTFGPAAVEDDPAGAGFLIEQSYTDWLAATNAKGHRRVVEFSRAAGGLPAAGQSGP